MLVDGLTVRMPGLWNLEATRMTDTCGRHGRPAPGSMCR